MNVKRNVVGAVLAGLLVTGGTGWAIAANQPAATVDSEPGGVARFDPRSETTPSPEIEVAVEPAAEPIPAPVEPAPEPVPAEPVPEPAPAAPEPAAPVPSGPTPVYEQPKPSLPNQPVPTPPPDPAPPAGD